MDTTRIDLGPDTVTAGGSPFALPAAQWRAIGDFLASVNATDAASSAGIAAQLPDYATLRTCAANWSARTHPNLLSLAGQISQYGSYFSQQLAPRLNAMISGQQAAQQGAALDALLQPAMDTAQRCATLAAALVPDLQTLGSTCGNIQRALPGVISSLTAQSVGIPGMGSNDGLAARLAAQIGAIAANLAQVAVLYAVAGNVPLADIERLRGAWGGISDDLAALREDMQTLAASLDTVLAGLDLQLAGSQWQSVAAEAAAFAAAA
ncbi:hypothetical protein [Duganella callida]|uniref:Uncharacterized protein n=1 Tax=Duganella callida TaxID=2561932 RepID=A0A4Y9SX74_9BURK|nr:hypothetical protein [Duganella callida]TFW31060.1 hypothetical protein E4L98_01180 [Duganella callida]